MLLDQIKTGALAVAIGTATAAAVTAAGCAVAAAQANIRFAKVIRFAVVQPTAAWPDSLFFSIVFGLMIGVAAASILFWSMSGVMWSTGPKVIESGQSAQQLTNKSATTHTKIFGGRFAGQNFFASIEDRGLVVGPPGTGKTAFLLNQILKSTDQNLNFVCVDMKPELHQILAATLEEKGYRVLRINPCAVDPAADHYNPLLDIKDHTDRLELCDSLLPIINSADAPFVEAQRDWLKLAVRHQAALPGGNLPDAYSTLSKNGDANSLLKFFAASPSSAAVDTAARLQAGLAGQKPDPLILAGLSGCLRKLEYLELDGVKSALGHSTFSLLDLGKSEIPTALFFQFEETKLSALGPLLSVLMTATLQTLIRTAHDRKPVAIFLDELGNIPPIPNLPQKLNTIRSRSMPTWMYFQTVEQINQRYGPKSDAVFLAAADVQMFFRLNDQNTRFLVSELVGTTIKKKHTVTKGGGVNGAGRTVATVDERVPVIEPHELGELMLGEVITLYRGASAKGVATPHFVDYPKFKR